MKKIYITLAIFFLTSILLFVLAFLYLDRVNHKIYHYIVKADGRIVGTIKIERFITEDKLIYKSASDLPFLPILTGSKTKLILDTRYNLNTYERENFGNGTEDAVYIENENNNISFVTVFQSEFAFLKGITVKNPSFILEDVSPVTYLPIIENYDFRKDRPQGFNAFIAFPASYLPPMKKFITLTSIKDEYLDIEAPDLYGRGQTTRRLKAQNLILKVRNYPQRRIWVAKTDKSLMKIEIPEMGLEIIRTFSPKSLAVEEYASESAEYLSRQVVFKNKKIQLSGVLTVPKKEGAHPAVLLVWGPGPQDRDYQGFFLSIADYLSKNGFCVLRFDKRGIGQSSGDARSYTSNDIVEDIKSALEYLASQKEVDPNRMALIGHSIGALHISKAPATQGNVKALVMMAPLIVAGVDTNAGFERSKAMQIGLGANGVVSAFNGKWSDDYFKLAIKTELETIQKIMTTKNNWLMVLGKRCFLKKMREDRYERPLDIVKRINIPVLILQGKEDDPIFANSAAAIDTALEEAGNKNHALIYFGYLGHFFGRLASDGIHRLHYEVDKDVLEKMRVWLEPQLNEPQP